MPVSGIVIRIDPEQRDRVVAGLAAMAEVELQPLSNSTILVAVLDAVDFERENALVRTIGDLPGVVSVSLSYHNFEDMAEVPPSPQRTDLSGPE
ncbi:periplasmic nitrate reductase chaperone NapD [Desulfuromonas soudanensis]|uniref:Periplasmic nitrate reductase chaperone NapD n=1 Tax=Desulfuromonas soudanensis TaxID=1603606 RepID=A0A0M4CXV2_9BACT|nr:chaperone NapD [Desulfuromonas soudanensis]ALC17141.1 periplasmic nitrate reductase chaperone NapD [Desulfuromonas soudanensis]